MASSARVGKKIRQETVAQLEEFDAESRITTRHPSESSDDLDRRPGLFDEKASGRAEYRYLREITAQARQSVRQHQARLEALEPRASKVPAAL